MAVFVIQLDEGHITINDQFLSYEGDADLVERLRDITSRPGIERPDGEYAPIDWTGPGGVLLALEIAEPRFKGSWRNRLPPELAAAEKPDLVPAGDQAGVVY